MSSADYQLLAFRAMCADDIQGATVKYGTQTLAATVGTFDVVQDITDGGFVPRNSALVQVAIEDLADGTNFHAGQELTVTPNTGPGRLCKISRWMQSGALIHLDVCDINESAG